MLTRRGRTRLWGEGLSEGVHEVEFELVSMWWDGVAQLCSVEVLEFGGEDE